MTLDVVAQAVNFVKNGEEAGLAPPRLGSEVTTKESVHDDICLESIYAC